MHAESVNSRPGRILHDAERCAGALRLHLDLPLLELVAPHQGARVLEGLVVLVQRLLDRRELIHALLLVFLRHHLDARAVKLLGGEGERLHFCV